MQATEYVRILDLPFDLLGFDEICRRVCVWCRRKEARYITLVNPHSVMLSLKLADFRRAIQGADLILPDGIGVIMAARLAGCSGISRTSGPMLMLHLCDRGRAYGLRHYFYGGVPGVPQELARRLTLRFPGMITAGTYSPPFETPTPDADAEDTDRINASGADIIWVGLGAPKQELWMAAHSGRFKVPVMIGVGAAFDFHSGNRPWAPLWMQKAGLEWAFRLASEPRRLWRKDLNSLHFVLAAAAESLRIQFRSKRST